jgi:hypothetical protein
LIRWARRVLAEHHQLVQKAIGFRQQSHHGCRSRRPAIHHASDYLFSVLDPFAAARVVDASRNIKAALPMAKLRTGVIEAISRRLHLLYDGIVANGVPERLAAIVTAADGDSAVLPAESAAA